MKVYLSGCFGSDRRFDLGLYGQLMSLLLADGHEVLTPYVATEEEGINCTDFNKKILALRPVCDGESLSFSACVRVIIKDAYSAHL